MVLLRNPRFWLMTALFYAFVGLVCVGIVLKPATPPAGRVAFSLVVVAIVAFGAHAFRAGIEVDDTGLTVRRLIGRRESVEWSSIDRVEFRPFRSGGVFVAPVLRDGRALTTRGLIFKRPSTAAANDAVDLLDSYLRRWGSPGRDGP